MDYIVPLHWWLLPLFSLIYLSSLIPRLFSSSTLSSPISFSVLHPCFYCIYPFLCRPQAGDDLWLLEDGLAGELLQYCHDHQASGSGQGRFSLPFVLWPLQPPVKMDGGDVFLELPLSFLIYQKSCCALCRGRKWLPLSDHEWSPLALVAAHQGQSFDVYEGPWRNFLASFIFCYSSLCWIQPTSNAVFTMSVISGHALL